MDNVVYILQNMIAIVMLAAMVFFAGRVILVHRSKRLPSGSRKADAEQELCKSCGYDTRGLTRCPECGGISAEGRRQALAKLRDAWPTENIAPRSPRPDEQPIVILITDNALAGRLLCQHLEARGVLATMSVGRALPGTVYATGKESCRLSVWSDDEERGRAIIEHLWPEQSRD